MQLPRLGTTACLSFAAIFVFLGPARGETAGEKPATKGGATSAPAPITVRVTGNTATHDFGTVPRDEKFRVLYEIENPTDKPIPVRRVVPDCECIWLDGDAPKELPPGITVVTMIFVVPDTKEPYAGELIVLTKDPARKVIHLRVMCKVKRK